MLAFDEAGYAAHIAELGEQWQRTLAEHGFEAAVVPAGEAEMYFQDDQAPPFHPIPTSPAGFQTTTASTASCWCG